MDAPFTNRSRSNFSRVAQRRLNLDHEGYSCAAFVRNGNCCASAWRLQPVRIAAPRKHWCGTGAMLPGRQRFHCRKKDGRGCGRTFNALTGTAFARMRKPELWSEFVAHFSTGLSLSKIAATGISIPGTPLPGGGIASSRLFHPPLRITSGSSHEADEKFFLRSFKGHRGWKRGQPPEPRPPRYRGSGALLPGLSWQQVPVLTA